MIFGIAFFGVIEPFEYTALIWSAILGYLLWNDIPDAYAIAGAVLIIGSGIYIIHRESLKSTPAQHT